MDLFIYQIFNLKIIENATKIREVEGSNLPRIETLWIETSLKEPKP